MLVLSRKKGESIIIQEDITITVLSVEGENIKLGISAPKEIDIFRKEVFEAIQQNNQDAVMDSDLLENVIEQLNKMNQK